MEDFFLVSYACQPFGVLFFISVHRDIFQLTVLSFPTGAPFPCGTTHFFQHLILSSHYAPRPVAWACQSSPLGLSWQMKVNGVRQEVSGGLASPNLKATVIFSTLKNKNVMAPFIWNYLLWSYKLKIVFNFNITKNPCCKLKKKKEWNCRMLYNSNQASFPRPSALSTGAATLKGACLSFW